MSSEYYTILTNTGLAKEAAAHDGGPAVDLTDAEFAVGDGGGAYFDPLATQVILVNEVWRGDVNKVYVDPDDGTRLIVEGLIPADEGGWDIREAGIFDAAGDLYAVGKYPLTTKPAAGSGAEKEVYVRMVLAVSNVSDYQLTIDSSVATVTQHDMAVHEALQLDPTDTDPTKEKHLSNYQAHLWEAAIAANVAAIAQEASDREDEDDALSAAIAAEAAARAAADIESGTVMLFGQSAAPTGWTKKADWTDDSMLIFTTGDVGSGGSVSPKSWTTGVAVAAHADHVHTGPNHRHAVPTHLHGLPMCSDTRGSLRFNNNAATGSNLTGNSTFGGSTATVTEPRFVSDYSGTLNSGYSGTGNTGSGGGASHSITQSTFTPKYQTVIAATKD